MIPGNTSERKCRNIAVSSSTKNRSYGPPTLCVGRTQSDANYPPCGKPNRWKGCRPAARLSVHPVDSDSGDSDTTMAYAFSLDDIFSRHDDMEGEKHHVDVHTSSRRACIRCVHVRIAFSGYVQKRIGEKDEARDDRGAIKRLNVLTCSSEQGCNT